MSASVPHEIPLLDTANSKSQRLACPSCGRKYLALFFRSRSTCPHCLADVQTDLKTVGIIETLIGLPVIWLTGTFLRIYLHDDWGLLSYALLIPPALLVDLLVVRQFVKARVVEAP